MHEIQHSNYYFYKALIISGNAVYKKKCKKNYTEFSLLFLPKDEKGKVLY